MSREDTIRVQGIVREVLPGSKFKVELCNEDGKTTGHEINSTISGKIRMNHVLIYKGDKVQVDMSVYDLTNGRIVWRYK